MKLEIDLRELEAFTRAVQQAPDIAAYEIRSTMLASVAVLDQAIVGRIPHGATGNLRGGRRFFLRGQPLRELQGGIAFTAAYGLPVERGRKPGKRPPVEPIELWVIRKLGLEGREAKSAAYCIARAIGARGTEGQRFVEQGMEAAEPHILKLWEILPQRLLDEIARRAGEG